MHQLCLLFPLLIVIDAAPMAQLLPNIPYRLDFSNHRLQPASFQGTKKRPFPQLNSEFPQPLLLDVQQDPASFPVDITPEETTVHPRIDWLSQQAYRLVQDHAKSPKYNFEGRFQTAVERNEVDISGMMEQKQDQPMEIEGESSGHGEMAEKSDKVIEKVIGESRKKPVEEEEETANLEEMKKTEEVQQEEGGRIETARTIEIKEQPKAEDSKKQVTEEKEKEKSEKIEKTGSKTGENEKKKAMAEDKKEIDVKELKKNVEKEGNHEVKETVKSEATVDKQVEAKKEKKITTAGKVEKKEKTAEETKEEKEKPETEHTKESLVVMGRPKSEENEEKEKNKDVGSEKKGEVAEKTESKKTTESEKKEEAPKKQTTATKKEEAPVEPETKKEEEVVEKLEDDVIEMIDEVVETNELRKLVARGVSAYPQAKDYLEPYRGGGYMKKGDHEELEAKVVYVDNERAINKMAKEILKAKNPSIATKEVPPQIQPEVQIIVVEQTGEKATTLSAPQSELHAITDEVSRPEKVAEIKETSQMSNNTTESTTPQPVAESANPETPAQKILTPSESDVEDVPESTISSSPEVPSIASPEVSTSNSTSAPQTSSDADAVVAAMIDAVDSAATTVAPKSIDTTEKSIAETQHEGPRHRVHRRRLLMF